MSILVLKIAARDPLSLVLVGAWISSSLGPDLVRLNISWPDSLQDRTLEHIVHDPVILFYTQFGV